MSFFPEEAFTVFDVSEEYQPKISLPKRSLEDASVSENKAVKLDEDLGALSCPIVILDEFSTQVERSLSQDEGKVTHSMRHEVAVPQGADYVLLSEHKAPTGAPFRKYNFTLDPFQQCATQCVERNESVLVSAHTSAGKTVIAEYAIAMALACNQRVVYTSPIKALSNQKYREFQEEFGDVGLMTGDVTLNPTASCLVMTTEILRSMLYRGSEVMREVAWVVFDEIHYMRDKERGVVWEETLILLPDAVRFVFLSATIPNARQFAEWICAIHRQPCHVVYTDYRPTPLQHYLFPAGGNGIHLAVDEKGIFKEENFFKALSILGDDTNDPLGTNKKRKKTPKSGPSDLFKIVKMILTKNYHPVIVFSFSKRECEANALQLSKIDFNNDDERILVQSVFSNAMASLSEEDRCLPQIENIMPLLKRGIGIHHSGLLPILKEVIEILFQEGLLKVLFATETFSIGLNMPARTVVFTSARKFDGKDFRWITSGEYIQMSGRAGRRGLDDRGIVILMLDERMEAPVAKNMIKGHADALNSAFHLTYNMILNLMRVEGISPEFLLERSFFQFQNNSRLPELVSQLGRLEEKLNSIVIGDEEEAIQDYYNVKAQLEILSKDYKTIIHHPTMIMSFLQSGRLVKIAHEGLDYGWGVLVNLHKKTQKNAAPTFVLDVLLYCSKSQIMPKPCPLGEKGGEMMLVPVAVTALDGISRVRIFLPKELKTVESRVGVYKSLLEVKKRLGTIPLLDPIQDIKIEDETLKTIIQKMDSLETKLENNKLYDTATLPGLYEQYHEKVMLIEEINNLKKTIRKTTAILHLDEFKCRKRVLRRLEFTNPADVIEMKGRVACEISTGDELLLTELMFNGVFNTLDVDQTVALLSCFVFQEKSDEIPPLKDVLAKPLKQMQDTARRIAKISKESKLLLDEEEYVQSFRPELMDVVYAWCQGAKFSQICKMTDVFEGSIIRAMRRLEELLRQMNQAARAIGNTELETKFALGMNRIKRDIVFANSLYL